MTSLQQSCLTTPLKISTHKSKPQTRNPFFIVSCKYPPNDHHENQENSPRCTFCWARKVEKQLAKLATVTLAAGVLTLGTVGDASAAKSGGQIGGQAFGSFAPRASFPNSRTNIYVNPPVAPSLLGGYGFGFGAPFYDGWAWSPFSVFTPCPTVSVDVGLSFDLIVDFMCLGAIAAVIEELLESGFDDDNDDDDDDDDDDDYYYY